MLLAWSETRTSQPPPHHVVFHCVPSYTFSTSFRVSYHKSHALGSLGAVSLATQFCLVANCESIYVVSVLSNKSTSDLKYICLNVPVQLSI